LGGGMNYGAPGRLPPPPVETRLTHAPVMLLAGDRLGGVATEFGTSNRGWFRENLNPKALNKSQADGWPGLLCTWNGQAVLGTTRANTLRLTIDRTGVRYIVDTPETAEHVAELADRGDIGCTQIAIQAFEQDWVWTSEQWRSPIRNLLSVRLIEVSPAIPDAVAARDSDGQAAYESLAAFKDITPEDVQLLVERRELWRLFMRNAPVGVWA
jgi:phage head maturation protease